MPASRRLAAVLCASLLSACSQFPATGPNSKTIRDAAERADDVPGGVIQIVDINESTVRQLRDKEPVSQFAEAFGGGAPPAQIVGSGDILEITLWETPPAALFGIPADPRTATASTATTLPPQMVDREGFIGVPFAGRLQAAGASPDALAATIVKTLKGKANQPQVLVRVVQNASSMVTVVGEVNTNVRMPLTAGGERLLDALAVAGGVRQPVSKVSLQLTRGMQYQTMPLEKVIRDPRQNIPLQPGDVLTALYQPLSFTALGATGRQDEVPFEAQGISLAQALGRIGGLMDNRSDRRGVFIFRFEPKSMLDWPHQPVAVTEEGRVPVVYRLDLSDPRSLFAMQGFTMRDRDLVYVSNAPAAELQKFLNVVFSAVYPVVNLINATN